MQYGHNPLGQSLGQSPEDFPKDKLPYFIELEFSSVGAAAQDSQSEPIGPRAFTCTHIAARSTQAFKLRLRDTAAGEDFMPGRVDLNAIVGGNQEPFELPSPWQFGVNSSVYGECENLGGASDTLRVVLIGYLEG
ncbi:MAG: hypothetical protein ACE5PV_15215 [Candidatus Poribacteria bacterium]